MADCMKKLRPQLNNSSSYKLAKLAHFGAFRCISPYFRFNLIINNIAKQYNIRFAGKDKYSLCDDIVNYERGKRSQQRKDTKLIEDCMQKYSRRDLVNLAFKYNLKHSGKNKDQLCEELLKLGKL